MPELKLEDATLIGLLIVVVVLVTVAAFKLAHRDAMPAAERAPWRPAGRRPWMRRRRQYAPDAGATAPAPTGALDITDVGDQLKAVMAAAFEPQKLLSFAEYRAFKIVENEVTAARRDFRVFAQVCLGEILKSSCDYARRSINGKRTDILVIDKGGWPVLAVEYQGSGHYLGDAAARDAVKKEALRKAGVGYVEVFEGDSEEQIRYRVRERLGWNVAPAPPNAGPPDKLRSASFAKA